MNTCGLLVHVNPDKARAVEQELLALPGVEVHGGWAEGKLVVTVEDIGQGEVADTLASIDSLAGVIGTALVYHYGGEDSALEESDRESHAA